MIKQHISSALAHYYDTAEKLGDLLLDKLENNFFLEAKLKALRFSIIAVADNEISGFHQVPKAIPPSTIVVHVSPSTPNEVVEHIIAHELAHMLFSNYNIFSDFCLSDDSFAITSVQRSAHGDDPAAYHIYGHNLEEILCDWIAANLVLQLNPGRFTLEELLETVHTWIPNDRISIIHHKLADHFISLFNTKPDQPLSCYDAFVEDEEFYYPHNYFLYAICHNQFNWFVYEYDKLHGKCAWEKMVGIVDSLVDVFRDDFGDESNKYKEKYIELYQQEITKYLSNPIGPNS